MEAREGVTFAPGQRDALLKVLTSSVMVLTGGPGTGKTTLAEIIASHTRRDFHRANAAAVGVREPPPAERAQAQDGDRDRVARRDHDVARAERGEHLLFL